MLKLDNTFLEELGLSLLAEDEKKKMLVHIYETLELRVGMKLAEGMTDEQLKEFEDLAQANNEEESLRWLSSNVPNYKEVVVNELEILKKEIKASAQQILTASKQEE